MKETTELLKAINATINSGSLALEDGKISIVDLQYVLSLINTWSYAIKDLNIEDEMQLATNELIDSSFASVTPILKDLNTLDAYDILALEKGLLCTYRFIARRIYNKGLEAGKNLPK